MLLCPPEKVQALGFEGKKSGPAGGSKGGPDLPPRILQHWHPQTWSRGGRTSSDLCFILRAMERALPTPVSCSKETFLRYRSKVCQEEGACEDDQSLLVAKGSKADLLTQESAPAAHHRESCFRVSDALANL